jgi:hypothetical protein
MKTFAAALAGVAIVSCGDHFHVSPPADRTPVDAMAADASAASDAGALDEASPDTQSVPDAAADTSGGVTGLWISDPKPALEGVSASCLECGAFNCGLYMNGCAMIAGAATDGPAKGTSKAELCVETLGCMLSSRCTGCGNPCGCSPLTKLGNCYCLQDDPSVRAFPQICLAPTPDIEGPCKAELERSLETTKASTIMSSFGDLSKGGSWALLLMECLADSRCDSCFPAPNKGPNAGSSDALDAGCEASHPGLIVVDP